MKGQDGEDYLKKYITRSKKNEKEKNCNLSSIQIWITIN